jgi:hypothetical protein
MMRVTVVFPVPGPPPKKKCNSMFSSGSRPCSCASDGDDELLHCFFHIAATDQMGKYIVDVIIGLRQDRIHCVNH